MTAKGSKDLTGEKRLHILAAVSYGKDVILNEVHKK